VAVVCGLLVSYDPLLSTFMRACVHPCSIRGMTPVAVAHRVMLARFEGGQRCGAPHQDRSVLVHPAANPKIAHLNRAVALEDVSVSVRAWVPGQHRHRRRVTAMAKGAGPAAKAGGSLPLRQRSASVADTVSTRDLGGSVSWNGDSASSVGCGPTGGDDSGSMADTGDVEAVGDEGTSYSGFSGDDLVSFGHRSTLTVFLFLNDVPGAGVRVFRYSCVLASPACCACTFAWSLQCDSYHTRHAR
jgi:hypothetical protein